MVRLNLGQRKSYIGVASILTVVAILIFWLSRSAPWIAEDFTYQFNFAKGGEIVYGDASNLGTKIQSLGDIFDSQIIHYKVMNGRFVAHSIVQFIDSFLNPTIYGILNALMWIVFILLLMRLCEIKWKNIRGVISVVFLVLIGINTYFIPSYQVGYIWMGVLSLLFLNLYLSKSILVTILTSIILAVLCLIIGNGQESYNIGIGGALIIYNFRHFKEISKAQWIMFFSFGLGALAVCLAPGTLNRASETGLPFFYSIEKFLIYPRVTYILIFTLIYYRIKGHLNVKEFFRHNEFFIYFFLVSAFFNILIGVYCNRQLFGMELAAMILTLRLLHNHTFGKPILILLGLCLLCDYVYKFYFVEKQNELISIIEKEWERSDDGRVFVDVMPLPFYEYQAPCPSMTYGKPALGTIGQRLRYFHNSNKPLVVYPEKLEALIHKGSVNEVYEYEPGCYFLVQDKKCPANFVLEREYNVLGFTHPKDEYEVVFDLNSIFNTEYCNIMKFDNNIPFVNNLGVRME